MFEAVKDKHGIEIESTDNFPSFYSESNCVVLAPGRQFGGEYPTNSDDPNDLPFTKQIYLALKADFIRAGEIFGQEFGERYRKFFKESEEMGTTAKLGFYRVTVDILKENISQQDFFQEAFGEKSELRLLEKKINDGVLDHKLTEDDRTIFETLGLAINAKVENRLTNGYRLIDYFPLSIDITLDYGRRLRETLIDPELDPKSILVVTNEPGLVCNMLAMMNPQLTPYLIGVSDNDSRRIRKDFIEHFKLSVHDIDPRRLDMAIIGDHDVYGRAVWGKNLIKYLREELRINIQAKDLHEFFSRHLYSVIERRIERGENPNTELAESIIELSNYATRSLGNGSNIIGNFNNSVYVGQELRNFMVTRHGLMLGRTAPLQVNYPTSKIRNKFIKGLEENKGFNQENLENPKIKKGIEQVSRKPITDPHVEKPEREERELSTNYFPSNIKEDGLTAIVSARKDIVSVGFNKYGDAEIKKVYRMKSNPDDECTAIATYIAFERTFICGADRSKLRIFDSKTGEKSSVVFSESGYGTINFVDVVKPKYTETESGVKEHEDIIETIADLEQILLVNHSNYGLLGFSLYEVNAEGRISLDDKKAGRTVEKGGHCLIKDGEKVYKVEDGILYSAKIEKNELTIEAYKLGYKIKTDPAKPEVPLIPYGPENKGYLSIEKINEFSVEISELNSEGLGEKISSFEVDANNNRYYIGTNDGKAILCKDKDKDDENHDKDNGKNNNTSYQVLYEQIGGIISNLQHFEYEGQNCIAFLTKTVTIGYGEGHIEVIVNPEELEKQGESTPLFHDQAVSWFEIDGDLVHHNLSSKYIIRNLDYDRCCVSENKGLSFGLTYNSTTRDTIEFELGEILRERKYARQRVGNTSVVLKQN